MSVEQKSEVSRREFLTGLGATATIGALAPGAAVANPTAARRGPPAKVRIGIVGGGFGRTFQWHLDPDCEVVAVCDKRDERLELLKQAYTALARSSSRKIGSGRVPPAYCSTREWKDRRDPRIGNARGRPSSPW